MTTIEAAVFMKFSTHGMPRPEATAYIRSLLLNGQLWQLPTSYLDLAADLLYPEGGEYVIN